MCYDVCRRKAKYDPTQEELQYDQHEEKPPWQVVNGVNIPRSSKQQSQAGTYVSRDQLQPGDLVFFYSPIHHVAIYMGNGKLLHTFGSPGVTIIDLNSGWWSSHYATAQPSNTAHVYHRPSSASGGENQQEEN